MTTAATCRLLIDSEPRSGAWNMAVDAALLESAVAGGPATLRWYRWERATLSIGHFQNFDAVRRAPRWEGVPIVRRLSGGGAIVHEHEWTYSVALPATHPIAACPVELYGLVHRALVGWLVGCGVDARLRGEPDRARNAAFLCFGRGDRHDVVVGGDKLVGSAQRRRRGAVLQHGSVLWRRSDLAPDFPGLLDVAPGVAWDESAVTDLVDAVATALGGATLGTLTATERARSHELEQLADR